uniref:Uncharacterized protein n=1 Tax=Tanacetum cinerariifolium TaxID=118510 RepID=A0A699GMW0_TANCI|nr:hypothetical protein [Tanacetum cinerariifolium]
MSEAPSLPLDDNVFSVATLLKYMGNDEKALAIVTKIVRDACAPGMAPIEQARAAIDAGRLDVAGKIFHGLRGSVGSLGAKRLITASLALEQAMVDRATDHIPARFDDVQAQYALVLAHAAAWLDQHASDHGNASLSGPPRRRAWPGYRCAAPAGVGRHGTTGGRQRTHAAVLGRFFIAAGPDPAVRYTSAVPGASPGAHRGWGHNRVNRRPCRYRPGNGARRRRENRRSAVDGRANDRTGPPATRCGQQIGLDRVGHETEIAAALAVAVDGHLALADHGRDPLRDHCRVRAARVLPGTEHIEIPQADGLGAIAAGVHGRIQFVDMLAHGVRRQRPADMGLLLGQGGMIAVRGARGGIHEAPHAGQPRGVQHIEKAAHVDVVREQRIVDRPGNRAQGRLVQDEVGAGAGAAANHGVADIAFDQLEIAPDGGADRRPHLLQVVPVAGQEIVEPHHALPQFQQRLQQVGADEAGRAGDQPACRRRAVGRHRASQPPHAHAAVAQRRFVELRFQVDEAAVGRELVAHLGQRPRGQLPVRHRADQRFGARQFVPAFEPHAVFVHGLVGIRHRIVDVDLQAVRFELVDHVRHLGVAQIGAVFLERQAQHVDPAALELETGAHHFLDGFFGHELGHAVVNAAPGQDHVRVVAQHFRLVGQVIRIDADAVAAHQAGAERQKIPLGAGRLQHFQRIDVEPVEDDGQFIHQRDVEVALGVFDDLGRLRHLDAGGPVHARFDHLLVQRGHPRQGRSVVAGDHLADRRQRMFLVAGIDALGRKTHVEIALPGQARVLFQDRDADFLGGAGVHGGLVDHHCARLHVAAHRRAGAQQRGKIGIVGAVHGRGHGHDNIIGVRQRRRVAAHFQPARGLELLRADLACRVDAQPVTGDLALGQIHADGAPLRAERHCQRQADISQSHHRKHFHESVMPSLRPKMRLSSGTVAIALLAMLAGCGSKPSNERLLADARQLEARGETKSAIIELKNLIQQAPADAAARLALGRLYLDTGDVLSAEKEMRRAMELGKNRAEVMPWLAQADGVARPCAAGPEPPGRGGRRVRAHPGAPSRAACRADRPGAHRAAAAAARHGTRAGADRARAGPISRRRRRLAPERRPAAAAKSEPAGAGRVPQGAGAPSGAGAGARGYRQSAHPVGPVRPGARRAGHCTPGGAQQPDADLYAGAARLPPGQADGRARPAATGAAGRTRAPAQPPADGRGDARPGVVSAGRTALAKIPGSQSRPAVRKQAAGVGADAFRRFRASIGSDRAHAGAAPGRRGNAVAGRRTVYAAAPVRPGRRPVRTGQHAGAADHHVAHRAGHEPAGPGRHRARHRPARSGGGRRPNILAHGRAAGPRPAAPARLRQGAGIGAPHGGAPGRQPDAGPERQTAGSGPRAARGCAQKRPAQSRPDGGAGQPGAHPRPGAGGAGVARTRRAGPSRRRGRQLAAGRILWQRQGGAQGLAAAGKTGSHPSCRWPCPEPVGAIAGTGRQARRGARQLDPAGHAAAQFGRRPAAHCRPAHGHGRPRWGAQGAQQGTGAGARHGAGPCPGPSGAGAAVGPPAGVAAGAADGTGLPESRTRQRLAGQAGSGHPAGATANGASAGPVPQGVRDAAGCANADSAVQRTGAGRPAGVGTPAHAAVAGRPCGRPDHAPVFRQQPAGRKGFSCQHRTVRTAGAAVARPCARTEQPGLAVPAARRSARRSHGRASVPDSAQQSGGPRHPGLDPGRPGQVRTRGGVAQTSGAAGARQCRHPQAPRCGAGPIGAGRAGRQPLAHHVGGRALAGRGAGRRRPGGGMVGVPDARALAGADPARLHWRARLASAPVAVPAAGLAAGAGPGARHRLVFSRRDGLAADGNGDVLLRTPRRPWPAWDMNAYNNYLSPFNALRVGKAWLWAALLLPLLRRDAGHDLHGLASHFVPGMLAGLVVVGVAVIRERLAFPGLLNFSSDYRITAPFSAMHTGGAALDGYLALCTPLLARWLKRTRSPWCGAAGLAVLALALYAGLATFSRGLYAAYALSLLVVVAGTIAGRPGAARGGTRRAAVANSVAAGPDDGAVTEEAARTAPCLSRPAWRRATAALAALLVLAACYPLVHSDYVGQRFAATATDFQLRVRHWSSTLAIMDDSAITASIGMGFGKFPSTYYWRNPAQETAPGYRFVDQSANRVLRLAAGAYAAGYGELLRIWQTVAIDAGHDYRLAIDVRNLSNMAFLHLRVCERQLLYPANCRALPLRRLDSEPGWQHLGLTFNSGALGSRAAPVRLELAAEGPGAVFDVDNVSLRSMPEDHEVLRNGDFTDASDYWRAGLVDAVAGRVSAIAAAALPRQAEAPVRLAGGAGRLAGGRPVRQPARRAAHRAACHAGAGCGVPASGLAGNQASRNAGFIPAREEIRVKRAFRRVVFFHQTAELADLLAHVFEFEPQQHGRGAHARAFALAAEIAKAQHALVKHHVTGIDLDDVIGIAMDIARVNIGNVDQRGKYALGDALVDGQPRRLAQAAVLGAQFVELVAVIFVGRQPHVGAVQAERHGTHGFAARFRKQRDFIGRMAGAAVDRVAAPAIHFFQQQARGLAPPVGIGHADIEHLLIERVVEQGLALALTYHELAHARCGHVRSSLEGNDCVVMMHCRAPVWSDGRDLAHGDRTAVAVHRADDVGLVAGGKIGDATHRNQHVHQRHALAIGERLRSRSLADHADLPRIRADKAGHDDRHQRLLDVFCQGLFDIARQLGGGFAGCLQVFDQRRGDLAVRAHGHAQRHFRVAPHIDVDHVAGADLVIDLRCRRFGRHQGDAAGAASQSQRERQHRH